PITRSDIWHNDGSVVLQAEDTQFRVHWSVLALHSSFFRDLQGLPQPADQPSVEGCPVVELSDPVEYVEYLLGALYNPFVISPRALSLPTLGALIQLGRKYDFHQLPALATRTPDTLEWWPYKATRIVHYEGLLYDILTLARENNILSALPCAYYRIIMRYSQDDLFDGISRRDGTTASLSPIDLRRCVLGRQSLVQSQLDLENTLQFLATHIGGCPDNTECGRARRLICSEFFWHPTRNMCPTCTQSAQESMSDGRNNMWKDLPSYFGLPRWNELKNDL
ncbi:hypothetical protein B0H11DRAFT_1711569, partial [Mycena galericulata]